MRSIVAFSFGVLATAGLALAVLAAPQAVGDDCAPGVMPAGGRAPAQGPGAAPGAQGQGQAQAAGPAQGQETPAPEKEAAITHPLLTAMAGDWSCDCAYPTGGHAAGDAKGRMILDNTALETEATLNWKTKDGKEETIHNVGIWKVGKDGKSVSFWGFSSHDSTADLLTGELTDDSVSVAGQTRWGPMRLTLTLKDNTLEQHLWIAHRDMGVINFKKK
jgi:hypothetical protein